MQRTRTVSFDDAVSILLPLEGGTSNHTEDSGGLTHQGVTQATYSEWLHRNKKADKPVTSISRNEMVSIYKEYWSCSGADKHNDLFGYHLFDVAVMSSCETAQYLRKESKGSLFKLMQVRKRFFLRSVAKYPKNRIFLQGWMNRLDNINATFSLPDSFIYYRKLGVLSYRNYLWRVNSGAITQLNVRRKSPIPEGDWVVSHDSIYKGELPSSSIPTGEFFLIHNSHGTDRLHQKGSDVARSEIGIHLDNGDGKSAGCIIFLDMKDFKQFKKEVRQRTSDIPIMVEYE